MSIPESNLRNMLNAISKGNHVLNETIHLHSNVKSDCPDCSFDPIRKESTDYNCPTCGGVGYLITDSYQTIPASVETEDDFKYDFTSVGKVVNGKIYVTIDSKEVAEILNISNKFNMNNYDDVKSLISQYDYITWKGAKYEIEEFQIGYLQGVFYEIGLLLKLIGSENK